MRSIDALGRIGGRLAATAVAGVLICGLGLASVHPAQASSHGDAERSSSFGGVGYAFGDIHKQPNPKTGSLDCPPGFKVHDLTSKDATGIGGGFIFCYKDPPTDFGGAFYVYGDGPAGCKAENPYTGACRCPDGFVAQDITGGNVGFDGGFNICYGKSQIVFGGIAYKYHGVVTANPWGTGYDCPNADYVPHYLTGPGDEAFVGQFLICYLRDP